MGPRAGLSTLLVLGSITLLIAILIGNGMGSRVIRQVSSAPDLLATPIPIATASPDDAGGSSLLTFRRRHVTSVATDPAFPDPRITPEPTPVPTARPTPRATATPTLEPPPEEPTSDAAPYTSPPLAFPLVKHSPGETSPPDDLESASPASATSSP